MSANSNNRKHTQRRPRRGRLALALAMALLAPAAWSQSLPDTGTVASGAATSNLDVGGIMNPGGAGTAMTITQTSSSAIINWESFNVDTAATLTFVQPDAGSVLLNRVIGNISGIITPSIINGTIASNGNIFLVNPMGILFGAGSSVNVGGLVASTLDITDADFLTGAGMANPHYVFTAGNPFVGYAIVNQGALSTVAGSQGTIALLAARIENQAGGTISAPGGSVVFGAASGANLDFFGDGLTTVTLTGNGLELDVYCNISPVPTSSCLGGIESIGNIAAVGGHVEMRTQTQDGNPQPIGTGLFTEPSNGGRIWIGGRIDARASATDVGSIILDAGQGNVDIGGVAGQTAWINVNSTAAGQNAGTIFVRGNQIFTYLCVGPGGVCAGNDSLGWLDATAYGAGANGGQITIDAGNLFYHTGVVQAAAASGAGGTIQINAGDAQIYNWITAEGLGGNGGTINLTAPNILLHRGQLLWLGGPGILYSQAVLSAYGSTNGGTVNLTGDLNVVDLGNVIPADPEYQAVINVRGMNGNGGAVDVQGGTTVDIDATWFVNADGTANGGSVNLSAMYMYVHGDMTANGDVTGGSIDLYANYNLDVSGNLTANGDVDGGSITLYGSADVTVSGTLTANGGMTPLPANSIGNGGTINVTGSDVDVSGNLYARGGSQQYIDPNNSSLNRYSFGGHVYVYGDSVNLSGLFDTTALNDWGTVQTDAYTYLFAAATTNVTSGAWFIDSNEVWVTTAAGASAHNLGAVLVDQTLAQSLDNGTSIYLNADNTVYSASGSGAVNIDSGASITSSYGLLNLLALNGIFGSGFTMNAGWGVFLDATGSDIQLDNFTMGGGTVKMQGNSVSLTSGHINTSGGGFEATATTNGIRFYSTWIDDSGDGDIHLDASGSLYGINARYAYLDTDGGDISIDAGGNGVFLANGAILSGGGAITVTGTAIGTDYYAVTVRDTTLDSGGGDIAIIGNHLGYQGGVLIQNSVVESTGGDISIDGDTAGGSSRNGVVMYAAQIDSGAGAVAITGGGDGNVSVSIYGGTIDGTGISIFGDGASYAGVMISGYAEITGLGGDIHISGQGYTTGVLLSEVQINNCCGKIVLEGDGGEGGLLVYDTTISGSSDITLTGTGGGSTGMGVRVETSSVSNTGGNISIEGDAGGGDMSVYLNAAQLYSTTGTISITGSGVSNTAVNVQGGSVDGGSISILGDGARNFGVMIEGSAQVTSAGGDIHITGQGDNAGVMLYTAQIASGGGNILFDADGGIDGLLVDGTTIASSGGSIEIGGHGGSGAGVDLDADSSVDAGAGMVIVRAANDGISDAIVLHGSITSTTAVNLRPLDETDAIYLGSGNGFVLDNAELANITSLWLVIGSAQQQGAIQVMSNILYGGNLTLQNQGGNASILLNAMLDVSGYTLGLFSGGSIVQTSAGAIHAESLLAMAKDDVLLNDAQNDVTGNTLAGSAGGQFLYLDANGLAIGNVSAYGFNVSTGSTTSIGSLGISATDILVQTLTGDLTLNGNVQGDNVDLVAAGVFLNPGGATITASNAWRVWASTWIGEDRGGLVGSGSLPNLYNCTYGGSCGVTVGSGNHFIYTQQPTLTVTGDDFSREYGDANPVFTFTANGLILGDTLANVLFGSVGSSTSSGSNVGLYLIGGSFTSPAGYAINFLPGSLTITPATLVFTSDPLTWYMGMPFPAFTGTVTGFKNGETLAQVFPNGLLWEAIIGPTGQLMPGYYPIFGMGNALNYVIVQAPSNQTALYLLPPPESSSRPLDFISEPVETFVYETNFETVAMCPLTLTGDDKELAGGDPLGNEWSKVRKRLNLVNCFSNDRRGGCGSF